MSLPSCQLSHLSHSIVFLIYKSSRESCRHCRWCTLQCATVAATFNIRHFRNSSFCRHIVVGHTLSRSVNKWKEKKNKMLISRLWSLFSFSFRTSFFSFCYRRKNKWKRCRNKQTSKNEQIKKTNVKSQRQHSLFFPDEFPLEKWQYFSVSDVMTLIERSKREQKRKEKRKKANTHSLRRKRFANFRISPRFSFSCFFFSHFRWNVHSHGSRQTPTHPRRRE